MRLPPSQKQQLRYQLHLRKKTPTYHDSKAADLRKLVDTALLLEQEQNTLLEDPTLSTTTKKRLLVNAFFNALTLRHPLIFI